MPARTRPVTIWLDVHIALQGLTEDSHYAEQQMNKIHQLLSRVALDEKTRVEQQADNASAISFLVDMENGIQRIQSMIAPHVEQDRLALHKWEQEYQASHKEKGKKAQRGGGGGGENDAR